MTFRTMLLLAGISLVLVSINYALQRLTRPDKRRDSIAGCCGMALPAEITHIDTQSEETRER